MKSYGSGDLYIHVSCTRFWYLVPNEVDAPSALLPRNVSAVDLSVFHIRSKHCREKNSTEEFELVHPAHSTSLHRMCYIDYYNIVTCLDTEEAVEMVNWFI